MTSVHGGVVLAGSGPHADALSAAWGLPVHPLDAPRPAGVLLACAPAAAALPARPDVLVDGSEVYALTAAAGEQVSAVAAVLGLPVAALPGLGALTGTGERAWAVSGDVPGVLRAVLCGADVALVADGCYPVPPLPSSVRVDVPAGSAVLRVTDRVEPAAPLTAVLHPPTLVIGVGSSRGVAAAEVGGLIDRVLAEAGLAPESVRQVATAEVKADEAGILAAVAERGWTLVCHPAAALAAVPVPNPSEVVRAEVGTPSVAEAAALLGTPGADLVVAKHKTAMATAAVARHVPRGRLAVLDGPPGPRAEAELRRATVITDDPAHARAQARRGHAVALRGRTVGDPAGVDVVRVIG